MPKRHEIRFIDADALFRRLEGRKQVTETGCWEFTGHLVNGYGYLRWQGATIGIHRLVASAVHGMDLRNPTLVARHKCDNPPCFNPDHIEPGTQLDNQRDRRERNPDVLPPVCKRGHAREGNYRQLPNGKSYCQPCNRELQREAYARRRGAA